MWVHLLLHLLKMQSFFASSAKMQMHLLHPNFCARLSIHTQSLTHLRKPLYHQPFICLTVLNTNLNPKNKLVSYTVFMLYKRICMNNNLNKRCWQTVTLPWHFVNLKSGVGGYGAMLPGNPSSFSMATEKSDFLFLFILVYNANLP